MTFFSVWKKLVIKKQANLTSIETIAKKRIVMEQEGRR